MAGGRPTKYEDLSVQLMARKISFINESALVRHIVRHAQDVCTVLGVSSPAQVREEVLLCGLGISRANSKARADILIDHLDGSRTIIEAKLPKNINDVMRAVGQLMLYDELLGGENKLVAIVDGPFHQAAFSACRRFVIPITWLMADQESIFMLEGCK